MVKMSEEKSSLPSSCSTSSRSPSYINMAAPPQPNPFLTSATSAASTTSSASATSTSASQPNSTIRINTAKGSPSADTSENIPDSLNPTPSQTFIANALKSMERSGNGSLNNLDVYVLPGLANSAKTSDKSTKEATTRQSSLSSAHLYEDVYSRYYYTTTSSALASAKCRDNRLSGSLRSISLDDGDEVEEAKKEQKKELRLQRFKLIFCITTALTFICFTAIVVADLTLNARNLPADCTTHTTTSTSSHTPIVTSTSTLRPPFMPVDQTLLQRDLPKDTLLAFPGINFLGLNIQNSGLITPTSSALECYRLCLNNTPNCTHFTWASDHVTPEVYKRSCWIKEFRDGEELVVFGDNGTVSGLTVANSKQSRTILEKIYEFQERDIDRS